MKTVINLKTDTEVKSQAQELAKNLGVPLSTIINALLKQFIRDQEILLSTVPKMTPYLESLIAETEADIAAGRTYGPFNTVDEMLDSLHSED